MISDLTPTLLKRAADFAIEAVSKPTNQPDPSHGGDGKSNLLIVFIFLINFIILIPIFILTSYTFEKVLPVLAIVEDEHPPTYEPIAFDDEAPATSRSISIAPTPASVPKPASAAVPTRPINFDNAEPITSSFMGTWRLLRSHDGFRSTTRGFACFIFPSVMEALLTMFLASFLGPLALFVPLLAPFLFVQYSTAWVHIVMTPPSGQDFWRRLPPFMPTLTATWRPIVLHRALTMATSGITYLLVLILNLNDTMSDKWEIPLDSSIWKYIIFYIVYIALRIFVVIPAYITLIRVQASLLPDDRETIIPFDRSFQGKIEPAIIGGTGYISVRDAWATFSKAAWRRLLILYARIYVIGVAVSTLVAVFLFSQFVLLSYCTKNGAQ